MTTKTTRGRGIGKRRRSLRSLPIHVMLLLLVWLLVVVGHHTTMGFGTRSSTTPFYPAKGCHGPGTSMMTLQSISSGASSSGSSSSCRSTTTLFSLSTSTDSTSSDHRFYAIDHADPIALQRFDPTLVPSLVSGSEKDKDHDDDADTTNICWIAVYRNPQYVVRRTSSTDSQRRQELFQAMKIATNPNTYNNNSNDDDEEENEDATTMKNEKREKSSVLSSSVTALKWADTLQISPPPTADDMMDVPIAVARLYPSTIHSSNSNNREKNYNENQEEAAEEDDSTSTSTPTRSTTKQTWIVDSLRCSLPKELTNPECDGGSEYLEAIGVAVDASLMRIFRPSSPPYPQGNQEEEEKGEPQSSSRRMMTSPPPPPPVVFDGSIRVKSTIYTRTVLEQRGFRPVESLSRDMATHYFCRDTCLQRYTQRITNHTNNSDDNNNNNNNNDSNMFLSPVARSISHSIVSLLQSQLEFLETIPPEADAFMASSKGDEERRDLDEPIMDPWAGIKMQL
jgi:hypothetical protein